MVRSPLAVPAFSGRVALFAALLLATPLAAQVRQPPPPVSPVLNPGLRKELPLALPDLVITSVSVKDLPIPSPSTTAEVVVQNKGSAPVTFPAGSVLVRTEAGQSGGITFQPMTAPGDYTIAPGEARSLTLTVGDPCSAGKAGKVTFLVDPDGKVRESNETNNAFVLSSVGSFTTGDLVALGMALTSKAPNMGTEKNPGSIPAGYAADLEVTVRNGGSGYALLCPTPLFRETQSPVSGKYGLRSAAGSSSAKAMQAGAVMVFKLSGAYAAGDLPPGSYPWAVLVNPDGRMPETSAANNAASGGVTVH